MILSIRPASVLGQLKFYHADSAGVHFYPEGFPDGSQCVPWLDTAVIEMHTWYYYEPHDQIIDSIYVVDDKMYREQRLFEYLPHKKSRAKLTYNQGSVFAEIHDIRGRHSYNAKKMTEFQFEPYYYTDMVQFGWDVHYGLNGYPFDSIYFQKNLATIHKKYYANGQLKMHDWIQGSEVIRNHYKENGKRIKDKKIDWSLFRQSNVYLPDSIDIVVYKPGEEPSYFCSSELDTTYIKEYTWRHSDFASSISDSTYFRNQTLVKSQKIYSSYPIRFLEYEFNYQNDTVHVRIYDHEQLSFITKYSAVKEKFTGNNWYESFNYNKYGWSVTITDNYVADSTYYQNDMQLISKQFYPNGQLKRLYENGNTTEYTKKGKIKTDWFAYPGSLFLH